MDDNVHKEDEHFKKAYKHYSEEPSEEVWEKINARLDGEQTFTKRKRFIGWKGIACAVLLLFISAAIYKFMFVKNNVAAHPFSSTKNVKTNKIKKDLQPEINKNLTTEENKNKSSDTHFFHHDKLYSETTSEIHSGDHNREHSVAQTAANKRNENETPVKSAFVNNPTFAASASTQNKKEELAKRNESNESLVNNSLNLQQKQSTTFGKHDVVASDTTSSSPANINKLSKALDSTTARLAAKTIHIQPFKKYWLIMPLASADFTQYVLDSDAGATGATENKNDIQHREKHQFSFSAGFEVKRQITQKLSVKTGLLYSNIAIGIQPQTLYATPDANQNIAYKFVTSSGYAYVKPIFGATPVAGDSIVSDDAKHHLQYLIVPLQIGYTLNKGKRFSITPEAGVSSHILLSTRVRTELNEHTNKESVVINKLQGVRNVYFSFVADAEMLYRINRHISLAGIPIFKSAINPINKNNVVKTYPYSISLAAGISYRF